MLNYLFNASRGTKVLNIKSIHGLNVVACIASVPTYQPVATAKLSRLLSLSVSYLESLMKALKDGGIVSAHRGPGGGYVLQGDVEDLFVWDVVRCFYESEVLPNEKNLSPEGNVFSILNAELNDIKLHFLKNYPLKEVTKLLPKNSISLEVDSFSRHFKPLVKVTLPNAPNSIFDLSDFIKRQAAYGDTL